MSKRMLAPIRAAFAAIAFLTLLATASPASAATHAEEPTAVAQAGAPQDRSARSNMYCRRGQRLRRMRSGGYLCVRGRRGHVPFCIAGYQPVRRGSGFVCRRVRQPAPPPPAPTPAPTPAAPAPSVASQHIATAFGYAKQYGDEMIQASAGMFPRTYWWLVDPKECTLVGGDRARCILYRWEEARTQNGGLERTIARTAVFAIWLEGTVYMRRTQHMDLMNMFDGRPPFYVVCSDERPGVPRCI